MCVIWICVSFLFKIEYPLTAPPPHKAYLLPPGTTQHKHTCALWHFPPLVSLFFHAPSCFPLSCLSLVFFPVYLSPYNSPLSKIFFYVAPSHSLSLLPLLCTFLFPLPFLFAEILSLTLSCLSHRDKGEVWIDSCCSHLCSLIGQWRSGAAGERANHSLRPPAGWQWPEGKWSHPCLEIWPAFGYVLTETQNGRKCSPLHVNVCIFY